MANDIKAQQDILDKLNIIELNSMQKEAIPVIEFNSIIFNLSRISCCALISFAIMVT